MKSTRETIKAFLGMGLVLLFVFTPAGHAVGQFCLQPPDGLVSWWPMDETSGTTVTDIVGGNDGTYVNGPTPVAGNVANALRFDGIDDYVDLGSNSSLNIPGSVTIDAWVKLIGFVGGRWYSYFVADFDSSGWVSQLSLGVMGSADDFKFFSYGGSASVSSSSGKTAGQWYHVAVVKDDAVKRIKLYVNGNLEGSNSYAGEVSVSLQRNKYLGRSCPEWGDYFNGDLDEVEIYNRALSDSEIQAIFNAGSAGKCKVTADTDSDGDGTADCLDCNDADNTVYPGAPELCDGKDNDCDGEIPANETTDSDGDGTVDCLDLCPSDPDKTETGICGCGVSDIDSDGDSTADCLDCDDADNTVYPGASERCNGKDDNCDGQVDEGVKTTYYIDQDIDGYGNPAITTQACSCPSGYVGNNQDCNDGDGSIYPGSPERCNGKDDNCDGRLGEGEADADDDTYMVCENDCNDGDAAINPGATETCNGIDDNCNGTTDEGVKTTYYLDADSDGYGNQESTTQACTCPSGYVENSSDCDDSDAAIYPGATEVCNGKDDDCDGQIDEGVSIYSLKDFILGLPTIAFDKNPEQRRHALSNKLDEVIIMIKSGNYQEAIKKLVNDIRAKTDGTVDGNPKNDWITDPDAQRQITSIIDNLIVYFQTLI